MKGFYERLHSSQDGYAEPMSDDDHSDIVNVNYELCTHNCMMQI